VTRNLAFYQKKASSVKQTDLRDMLKKDCKSVCISATVISPDTLSHTLSAIKTPENTKKRTLIQQMKDISKLNTFLMNCGDQV
jgi:hypothetical protein